MSVVKQWSVMIVDDDQHIASITSLAFKTANFLVRTANSGVEAEKIAFEFRPDAVVTDIIMDNGDGIETMLALRKMSPAIKIVAISGGGRIQAQDFLELARHLGADSTMSKPFRPSAIVEEVSRLLDGSVEKRTA